MISLKIVGLSASDFSSGETLLGDAQIIYDGQNYDVIDGNCGMSEELWNEWNEGM